MDADRRSLPQTGPCFLGEGDKQSVAATGVSHSED